MDSPDRRDQFAEDGFVVIDRPIIGPAALGRIRADFAAIFSTGPVVPPWLTKTIQDPDHPGVGVREVMYPMAMRSSLYRRTGPVRAVADDLLGGPTRLVFEHAIHRPAHCVARTSWHQDSVYFDDELDGVDPVRAHIWIPLVATGPDSGGMRYVTASHRQNLVHQNRGEHLVLGDDFPPELVADPLVPAGGCAIHHPSLVHGANGNPSGDDRVAWILHFQLDERPAPIRRAIEVRAIAERRARVLAWRARQRNDR